MVTFSDRIKVVTPFPLPGLTRFLRCFWISAHRTASGLETLRDIFEANSRMTFEVACRTFLDLDIYP